MMKLFIFGLENGFYGVGTDGEIQEMCKDYDTTIYSQELATYKEVEDWLCWGGQIEEGIYKIKNGVIEVCGEDEDYEIVFIKNSFINENKATI